MTRPEVSTVDEGVIVPWWHWFHSWTQWQLDEAVMIPTAWQSGGVQLIQRRHCVRCLKMRVRKLRAES